MPQKRITMRIIAGKYRHRLIFWPEDNSIRPTKDRVREAIFAALGDIEGKTFLDLYAGSGAMGIEAISRGAANVVFVDKGVLAIKCINENISALSISEKHSVIRDSDENALRMFKDKNMKFDIIFMDPPYKEGKYEEMVHYIFESELILPDGIIICESNRPLDIDHPSILKSRVYKYGETVVTFFWRKS